MAKTEQRSINLSALRGRVAAPRGVAPTATEEVSRSDQELLKQLSALGDIGVAGIDLAIGSVIFNPESNNREYRGKVVAARSRQGGIAYQGITNWGPAGRVGSHQKVVYEGNDIEEAVKAVNEMIGKKLAKGYLPARHSAEAESFLYKNRVRERAAELL